MLLPLELPHGVTAFHLDPTAPTNALSTVDRFQTVVIEEGIHVTNVGFSHLVDITSSEYSD